MTDQCEFFSAAKNGDYKRIESQLKKDYRAIMWQTQASKDTAWHLAAEFNHMDTIVILEKYKASLFAKNAKGETALHLAAKKQNFEIVEWILTKEPSSVDIKDNNHNTPLLLIFEEKKTVTFSHIKKIKNLVTIFKKFKANFKIKNKNGESLVTKAIKCFGLDYDILKMLAEAGAPLDGIFIDSEQYPEILDFYEEKEPETEELEDDFELISMGKKKPLSMLFSIHTILEKKAALQKDFFHVITKYNDIKKIAPFLKKINPSTQEDTTLATGLHYAAAAGKISIITFLLSSGANINAQDCDGTTPLHWAARHNQLSTYQFLINKGANVNICDSMGKTAFSYFSSKITHTFSNLYSLIKKSAWGS